MNAYAGAGGITLYIHNLSTLRSWAVGFTPPQT